MKHAKMLRETQNLAKQPVSFEKQQNSFCNKFCETRREKSFAGNPICNNAINSRLDLKEGQ
jgi:hypothetical protein